MHEANPARSRVLLAAGLLGVLVAAGVSAWLWLEAGPGETPREPEHAVVAAPASNAAVPEATPEQVGRLCGVCHPLPPADVLPRAEWKRQVRHGFDFAIQTGMKLKDLPSRPSFEAYFEKRAPAELALPRSESRSGPPVRFARRDFSPDGPPGAAVSQVKFAHYSQEKQLDLLACDMFYGRILLLKPYESTPKLEVLYAGLPHPAHLEVVDLDGDGVKDLLVANMGDFYPTNKPCGSVVWLRGSKQGTFTPHTLLENVGRVVDVQAADLNGDGKLDLAVAAFGWTLMGSVLFLENRTTSYEKPVFEPRVLDGRHGAIHVPIVDINGDGRPDIVTLISQEHETVAAYLNDGKGQFTLKTIFTGPHPAFGSTGIQVVDLNGDGRLDVLYTNGDSLDSLVLRPYHGVRWLENRGAFPFVEHHLTPLCGVNRALTVDFEGQGTPDILAVSLLPRLLLGEECRQRKLDSIILLRQAAPGRFLRYTLESISCDHATCDAGDFDGDGRIDFATASFVNLGENNPNPNDEALKTVPWVSVWRNLGVDER